jgi:hypothetical protein
MKLHFVGAQVIALEAACSQGGDGFTLNWLPVSGQ